MNYEYLFDYDRIDEDTIVSMTEDELVTGLLLMQARLDEIKEFIEDLISEIESKEILINEIHHLTDI